MVQLSANPLLLLIEAVGFVLSEVVVTFAVAVHPFAAVTVTVNVLPVDTEVAVTAVPLDHK